MTRHFDRQGAEDRAKRDATRTRQIRYVTIADGPIRPGGQWLNLSEAEYRRMNVIPAISKFGLGDGDQVYGSTYDGGWEWIPMEGGI